MQFHEVSGQLPPRKIGSRLGLGLGLGLVLGLGQFSSRAVVLKPFHDKMTVKKIQEFYIYRTKYYLVLSSS